MKKYLNKGFTLIELLVVIAIIGLLSSVVLASLNGARGKARDAARKQAVHQINLAVELYKASNNGNVPTLGCTPPDLTCYAVSSGGTNWTTFTTALQPYLKVLPSSLNGVDYVYVAPAAMPGTYSPSSYQVSVGQESNPSTLVGYSTNGVLQNVGSGGSGGSGGPYSINIIAATTYAGGNVENYSGDCLVKVNNGSPVSCNTTIPNPSNGVYDVEWVTNAFPDGCEGTVFDSVIPGSQTFDGTGNLLFTVAFNSPRAGGC